MTDKNRSYAPPTPKQIAEWEREADWILTYGGGNSTVQAAAVAMGIGWMTKEELNEAIPPAYTEFIGEQLIDAIRRAA